MRDTGCLDHWQKTYSSRINKCTAPAVNYGVGSVGQKRHRLSLADLSGLFLLLLIGLTISGFIFLARNRAVLAFLGPRGPLCNFTRQLPPFFRRLAHSIRRHQPRKLVLCTFHSNYKREIVYTTTSVFFLNFMKNLVTSRSQLAIQYTAAIYINVLFFLLSNVYCFFPKGFSQIAVSCTHTLTFKEQ